MATFLIRMLMYSIRTYGWLEIVRARMQRANDTTKKTALSVQLNARLFLGLATKELTHSAAHKIFSKPNISFVHRGITPQE